jgi:hypothetical protein
VRRSLALPLIALSLIAAACADDGGGMPTATPAASPTSVEVPAITIDEPAAGATVRSPFTVSGTANVFEGALIVDVMRPGSDVPLCTSWVQATSGTGTRGSWETTIAVPPLPDDAPITLRAYSISARDGSVENLVERPVTLSAEHPNIVIEQPPCGARVERGALAVSGLAQVFEAVLFVDVRDASGTALVTERVMAASGTEYSPWSATLDLSSLEAGRYRLVAYTHSPRDGSVIDEFPVEISVEVER